MSDPIVITEQVEIIEPDYKLAFGQLAAVVGMIETAFACDNPELAKNLTGNARKIIDLVHNGPKAQVKHET